MDVGTSALHPSSVTFWRSAAFRQAGDTVAEAKTLSALADLWAERGDLDQALDLERQALAVSNRLPDPAGRTVSHNNLANYLGRASRQADALPHRLAAVLYLLVSGHGQGLSTTLHNLAVNLRQAAQANPPLGLPAVADLLARPEFHALARFLADRGADPAALQARVSDLASQARAPTARLSRLPPELQALLAPLAQAAAAGLDTEPMLAALRAQWLAGAPDLEADIDQLIDAIRAVIARPPGQDPA